VLEMSKYVDIIGGQPQGGQRPVVKERLSTIVCNDNGSFSVMGNLPHAYHFEPASSESAKALISHLQQWIENEEMK
jgi:hypothetical protein